MRSVASLLIFVIILTCSSEKEVQVKEPIREYCRLGLVHFMAWPACIKGEGPIVETVAQMARDPDFEVLEIGPIVDAGVRREVVAIAEQSRLALAFAAQPAVLIGGLNTNSL